MNDLTPKPLLYTHDLGISRLGYSYTITSLSHNKQNSTGRMSIVEQFVNVYCHKWEVADSGLVNPFLFRPLSIPLVMSVNTNLGCLLPSTRCSTSR